MKQIERGAPRPRTRIDTSGVRTGSAVSDVGSGPVSNYVTLMGYTAPQGVYRTMSDVIVPSFNARKGAGEVFFNPMTRTRLEFNSSSDSGVLRQHTPAWAAGQTYRASGDYLGFLIKGSPDPSLVMAEPVSLGSLPVDAAISEACTQAASRPSDANLLVALAESQKTLRMLPQTLDSVSGFLRRINSVGPAGSGFSAARSLQQLRAHERLLTETWLQLRFGLRPLIMDLAGALHAVKRTYDDVIMRQTSRGFSTKVLTESISSSYAGLQTRPYTRTSQAEVSVRAMSLWQGRMEVVDQLGLSVRNVPEAVVDLTRFSFVLNWLINVNDFARSIGSAGDTGWDRLGGCYVVKVLSNTTWQFIGGDTCTQPQTYAVLSNATGVATATKELVYRVPGLTPPKLAVRADPFRFLTDLRLIDSVTLLSQQLRGRNVRRLSRLPGV